MGQLTPEKKAAIEFAAQWALSLMHWCMNPKPKAIIGLNPPHRPQGTPSRASRRKAARFRMELTKATHRRPHVKERQIRATGRGA